MKYIASIFLFLLVGCGSYHNLNVDDTNSFGGGFTDTKISEGLFYIVSKSNFAPWTNYSAAHKTFERRSAELCGSKKYQSLNIEESNYEMTKTMGAAKYIISQVSGYVICDSSNLSITDAKLKVVENEKSIK